MNYCALCRCKVHDKNRAEHDAGWRHLSALREAERNAPPPREGYMEALRAGYAPLSDNEYWCAACSCKVSNGSRNIHERGARHRANVIPLSHAPIDRAEYTPLLVNEYWCEVCSCKVSNGSRNPHEAGARHRENLSRQGVRAVVPNPLYYCEVCGCFVVRGNRDQHNSGRFHRSKAPGSGPPAATAPVTVRPAPAAAAPQAARPRLPLAPPPPPVSPAPALPQAALPPVVPSAFDALYRELRENASRRRYAGTYFLIITSRSDLSHLTEHFLTSVPQCQKYYFGPFRMAKLAVEFFDHDVRRSAPDGAVSAAALTQHLARHFDGNNAAANKNFVVSVGDKPDNFGVERPQYLLPLEPYDLPTDVKRHICSSRVEYFFTREALFESCLAHLKRAKEQRAGGGDAPAPHADAAPRLSFQLTRDNFKQMLHALVYCEEAEMTNALHRYDISGATFSPAPAGCRRLKVRGLAEKRPSVLVGDQVCAIDAGRQVHVGFVHRVYNEDIDVHFAEAAFRAGGLFDVEFTVKRADFRVVHRSIDLCNVFLDASMAQMEEDALQLPPPPLNDTLNELQRRFVNSVLSAQSSKLRILWGPPGTGKTTTVVGLLRSLLDQLATTRAQDSTTVVGKLWSIIGQLTTAVSQPARRKIIVCTPSNASADHITELLSRRLPPTKMLRVLAFSRDMATVPAAVRPFTTRFPGSDRFRMPLEDELMKADIIVVTLGTAGRLFGMFPHLRCSHLIVDEAGQATEADFCAALTFCDSETERIVLAGDPKQLGPVIQSSACKQFNFHISPLERLTSMDSVVHGPCTVELQVNYRSHPEILKLVNVAYDDVLQPPPTGQERFRPILPGRRVRWFHLVGTEGYENDSPSIMNMDEAEQVVRLIAELLLIGEQATDIIVLAPYVKQIYKIREVINFLLPTLVPTLHQANPDMLRCLKANCGSVELFQGREAKNVLLSCVRSTALDENVEQDVKRYIGFLAQPQRANVAVSRAVDRLWIVANVQLLYRDQLWRRYIQRSLDLGYEFRNVRPEQPFLRPTEDGPEAASWAAHGMPTNDGVVVVEGEAPIIRED